MAKEITYNHIPSLPDSVTRLTVRQLSAIDLLVEGKLDREVADAVGVSRETVTRWRNGHAAFQAELNRMRATVWQGSQDRVRSLAHEALETLAEAMREGDVRAAVAMVKIAGLQEAVHQPDGDSEPGVILWRQAMKRAIQERALAVEEGLALSGDALAPLANAAEEARARGQLRERALEIMQGLIADQTGDDDE